MFYELSNVSDTNYFNKLQFENFSFPLHMHNCFELVVCLTGKINVKVDGNEYALTAGEGALVFPHQLHSFESGVGKDIICIFSPKLVSAYYGLHFLQKPMNNKFVIDEGFISALEKINSKGRQLYLKGLMYLICDSFDQSARYVENINKTLLEKIFIFINENFKGICDLKTIASNMGYNSSYISRYFKKCVGINLCDYISMVRLSNVCYLYENSSDTILSFAIESGFDSLRTFNRNFKKFYGVSPKEYYKRKDN